MTNTFFNFILSIMRNEKHQLVFWGVSVIYLSFILLEHHHCSRGTFRYLDGSICCLGNAQTPQAAITTAVNIKC